MFPEALSRAPDETAGLLVDIWPKCSQIGVTLKHWDSAYLVPLYEKDDENDPKSNRPVSLLLHGRRIVESAVKILFIGKNKENENRFNFQKIVGSETAMLVHLNYEQMLKSRAILHLPTAYDLIL